MATNLNRQPRGLPIGGQFAASAKDEAEVTLSQARIDPVGSCPDCDAPLPGRVGVDTHAGRTVDVFVPGSRCSACPHIVPPFVYESDPDDEGYFYEVTMEQDGTLVCDGFNDLGDHTGRLWAYEPGHPLYDDEAKALHTTSADVVAGLTARDGHASPEKPFTLSSQDRLTLISPAQMQVGDTVLTSDDFDNWRLATVTSLDNDHKSTSIEFDGNSDDINSVSNDEPFFKVERGALNYIAYRSLDIDTAISGVQFQHALVNAKPGDRLTDPDGDVFQIGSSTATRYYDGCVTCADAQTRGSDFFPPHKPSPRCHSGGRHHCTCEICF